MFKTRLFDWAEEHEYTIPELARLLEYGERQMYRWQKVHRKRGLVGKRLRDRAIAMLGDEARGLFVPAMPAATVRAPVATVAPEPGAVACGARDAPSEPPTRARP